MRSASSTLLVVVLAASAVVGAATSRADDDDAGRRASSADAVARRLAARDGGGHGHGHGHGGGVPQLELNETDILLWHALDPLSYFDWDVLGKTSVEDLGSSHEHPDEHGHHRRHGDHEDEDDDDEDEDDEKKKEDKDHHDEHDAGGMHMDDDVEDLQHSKRPATYGWLMSAHVATMIIAFFGVLPLGIVLRGAKSSYHLLAQAAFLLCISTGWFTSFLYTKLTPNLYEHAAHGGFGYFILIGAFGICIFDFFTILSRAFRFFKTNGVSEVFKSPKSFWTAVVRNGDAPNSAEYTVFRSEQEHDEYGHLVENPEEEERYPRASGSRSPPSVGHGVSSPDSDETRHVDFTNGSDSIELRDMDEIDAQKARNKRSHHIRMSSVYSTTSTLRDPQSPPGSMAHFPRRTDSRHQTDFDGVVEDEDLYIYPGDEDQTRLQKAVGWIVYLSEWLLVVLAYACTLTGGLTYVGFCRASYVNGCLAHFIKGSIFFLYGVYSFTRFLGAFAQYGWAWNRAPVRRSKGEMSKGMPSAEMIECALIFTYGITNTWLERTSAKAGDPFSAKDIQHISIAVMYWFAGMLGMALESRRVKRLLSLSAFSGSSSAVHAANEPVQYVGSFNPFPALAVGVTGLAMAAHHQEYKFAVDVHSLWGNLLALGSIMRCVTYFFLWLRPPQAEKSVLPSRPPTEALASFFMATGGLVFIASTEQIVYAMMRQGKDDLMMILNVTVALTCFIFAWCAIVLAVKGWARDQVARRRGGVLSLPSRRGRDDTRASISV